MTIARLLVVDPTRAVAEVVARRCGRLASEQIICTTAEEAVATVAKSKPELVIVALQLLADNATDWFAALRKEHPSMVLLVTYAGQLTEAELAALRAAGVDLLFPDPLDIESVYRVAAAQWGIPLRRQTRISVGLDVRRPDGVLLGRTIDVSQGGMALEAVRPIAVDACIVADIGIPRAAPVRVKFETNRITGGGAARIVVRGRFICADPEAQERLVRYLASIPGRAAAVHGCLPTRHTTPTDKPTKLRDLSLPSRGHTHRGLDRLVLPEK